MLRNEGKGDDNGKIKGKKRKMETRDGQIPEAAIESCVRVPVPKRCSCVRHLGPLVMMDVGCSNFPSRAVLR